MSSSIVHLVPDFDGYYPSSNDLPLPDFYGFYPDFHLMVCSYRGCRCALVPRDIKSHMGRHISPEQSAAYAESLGVIVPGIKGVAQAHSHIMEMVPIRPIREIPIEEGFKCTWDHCEKLFTSKDSILHHFTTKHRVKNAKKTALDLISLCYIQCLSGDRYFFEVIVPDSAIQGGPTTGVAPEPTNQVDQVEDPVQAILGHYQQIKAALPQTNIELFDSPDEFSAFFKETKYLDFLKGKNITMIYSLLGQGDHPSPKPEINWAFFKVALLFTMELGEAMVPFLPRTTLTALNTFTDASVSLKGMRKLQNHTSLVKYSSVLQYFFMFLLNSYDLQVSAFLVLHIFWISVYDYIY
jgi:hypothetical protein